MKTARVLISALIFASMIAMSACQEEVITKKNDETGESQQQVPEED